jgi:hypothetical protein
MSEHELPTDPDLDDLPEKNEKPWFQGFRFWT